MSEASGEHVDRAAAPAGADAGGPAGRGPAAAPPGRSYWSLVWRQFRHHVPAMVGLVMVALLFLVAAFAPFLTNKYPYFWRTPSEGLTFPLLRALGNQDLMILAAAALFLLIPVTKRLLARTGWMFWQLNPVRRAAAVNLLIWIVALLLLTVLRVVPDRIFEVRTIQVGGATQSYRVERDYRRELADGARAVHLFPPIRYAPTDVGVGGKFEPPDLKGHFLGTDRLGRSNAARIIYGTRVSLAVGFIAVAISVSIGILVGGISAYFGGWVDLVLQRVVEIFICFPAFFLLLTIIAFFGPKLWLIMVALGLTSWTGPARLIRSGVLQVKQLDYVTAARAGGIGPLRIIISHALPNTIAPVLVGATFGIAGAVTYEASLSFLGLGDPDYPSWGLLLQQVREVAGQHPSLVFIAGFVIFFAVLGYNLVGEGLRDAIDPRLKV